MSRERVLALAVYVSYVAGAFAVLGLVTYITKQIIAAAGTCGGCY